jgi:hypothetical protein
MENERILIAALILIALIVGANFAMYGIVRGAVRDGGSRWMDALRNSLRKPLEGSSNKSMDELHRMIEEIERKKKKER